MKKVIGLLLHYANKSKPKTTRDSFFKLKEKLVKKYGCVSGFDMQHIYKECHSCDNGMFYKYWEKDYETCYNCRGTGVYADYYVRLDRYCIGEYGFHVPNSRFYEVLEGSNEVVYGYIKHRLPKYGISRECLLWLYLLFDFSSFKLEVGSESFKGFFFTPLLIVDRALFLVNKYKREIKFLMAKNECCDDSLPF
jgi:hypothetical protein